VSLIDIVRAMERKERCQQCAEIAEHFREAVTKVTAVHTRAVAMRNALPPGSHAWEIVNEIIEGNET